MKILDIRALAFHEIKVIRFARFMDHRGYFTESYRMSDFESMDFLSGLKFLQCNESHSRAGVIRGLHFQWDPPMGKLVRTIRGRMIDMVMDVRRGSKNFGKIIACDMPSSQDMDYGEWIWVPPGFAHGNYFTKPTTIQYFCTGSYNPSCEAGISPLSPDIDWSLCDGKLRRIFDRIKSSALMTDKDRNGFTLEAWSADSRSCKMKL